MADIVSLARDLGIPDTATEARGRGILKVDPDLVGGHERGRVERARSHVERGLTGRQHPARQQ